MNYSIKIFKPQKPLDKKFFLKGFFLIWFAVLIFLGTLLFCKFNSMLVMLILPIIISSVYLINLIKMFCSKLLFELVINEGESIIQAKYLQYFKVKTESISCDLFSYEFEEDSVYPLLTGRSYFNKPETYLLLRFEKDNITIGEKNSTFTKDELKSIHNYLQSIYNK